MTHESVQTYYGNDLAKLDDGIVELHVPLLNDVIQIGAIGRNPAGSIQVVRDGELVTISRPDDQPLQAEVVEVRYKTGLGFQETFVERTPVFIEPVPLLQLRHEPTPGMRPAWSIPSPDTLVTSPGAIEHLIYTIGLYAALKQGRRLHRSIG